PPRRPPPAGAPPPTAPPTSSRPASRVRVRVRVRQVLADAAEHLGVGLQVGVADLAVQLDNLLQLGDRPVELPLSAIDHRHVIAGHRLPGPVPDLPRDRQRLPEVAQRPPPPRIPESPQSAREELAA